MSTFRVAVHLNFDPTFIYYILIGIWFIMALIFIHIRHQELLVIERHGTFLKHHGRPEGLKTRSAATMMFFSSFVPFLYIILYIVFIFKTVNQWNQVNKLHNEFLLKEQANAESITE